MKKLTKIGLTSVSAVVLSLFGFTAAFGYGGGGGGVITPNCLSVEYSQWGACVNGFKYRDIKSQTPYNCTLSVAQQLARSESCTITKEERKEVSKEDKKEAKEIKKEVKKEVKKSTVKKVLGAKVYAEGTLIRKADKKIFVIKNGKEVHIKNLLELRKYFGRKIVNVK